MIKQCLISTVDNPFDPFEDFESWLTFDIEKGYYSCNKLMRVAQVSDEMSETEKETEIERAIDSIIKNDFTDTYIKVVKDLNDFDENDIDSLEKGDDTPK